MGGERAQRVCVWTTAAACLWLICGCGGSAPAKPAGSVKVSGAIGSPAIMGVRFVPLKDGKPDEAKSELTANLGGRYETYLQPGKYEVQAAGANGKGPKVGEIEVGASPATFDVRETPKKSH